MYNMQHSNAEVQILLWSSLQLLQSCHNTLLLKLSMLCISELVQFKLSLQTSHLAACCESTKTPCASNRQALCATCWRADTAVKDSHALSSWV